METASNPAREGTDAPGPRGAATPYSIEVGQTFIGTQSTFRDRDSVKIDLVQGETYTFSLKGAGAGVGTLQDAFLTLYAPEGWVLRRDDDSGAGGDAVFTYTAPLSGTYVLATGLWSSNPATADSSTGTYELSVVRGTSPLPDPEPTPDPDPDPTPDPVPDPGPAVDTTPGETPNLDALAEYLTDANGGPRAFQDGTITVNIDGLTAAGRKLANWAFEAWEAVADIDFVQTSGAADITFDDNLGGAFASWTTQNGNILSARVNVSTNWVNTYGDQIDSYSFQTYLHEVGHAIGLWHQGPYNGGGRFGVDNIFPNDSWDLSVMSYFSQRENTNVDADYANVTTAQRADIVAIQDLYGAPGASSQTIGNTVYGQNTNLTGYAKILFDGMATGQRGPDYDGRAVSYTVYDEGGVDTLNFGYSALNQKLNLNDDTSSDIDGVKGGLSIARGTVVENAISGSGNDILIGNHVSNWLIGGGGNDNLIGAAGNDTLSGGSGNDVLFGGTDNDVLSGGAGQDTFRFFDDMGQDRITDFSASQGDRLIFDDALWGGTTLSVQQVLSTFSSTNTSGTTFDFGADTLTVDGLTDLTGSSNWIELA